MFRLNEKEKSEALTLLEDLLRIESVNNHSRELDIADFLNAYFNDTDYERIIQKIDEKRGNFLLKIKGEEDGLEIWNGHMDTVPYGDLNAWSSNPATPVIKDGKIYARGTSDMKGGLAAMAYALHFLSVKGIRPRKSILFAGTCDEEKGGLGALSLRDSDLYEKPELLFIGEPTDGQIGIAQKGCMWIEILIKGKTSHGAYPFMGVNAAEIGFAFCSEIKEFMSKQSHAVLQQATAAVTKVSAGVANNMLPDEAVFIMDLRSVPAAGHDKIKEKIQQFITQYEAAYPGLQITYTVLNERRPIALNVDHPYTMKLKKCIQEIGGYEADYKGIYFFTDASVFLEKEDVPCLLFGPGNPQMCHKPDEYMELDKYYQAIEIYLQLLTN